MAKKARQRISYVLERADKQFGGHIKGVNGLAVDRDRSILYSGGRDGILCAWDLNLDLTRTNTTNPAATAAATTDSTSHTNQNTTRYRTQHLAHTNWICDLVLVQNNNAVVTASQDQLVKLWRPHAAQSEEPYKIGEHVDYVRCVASPSQDSTWVATGGLDRKIYLWDLNGGGKTQEIDTVGEELEAKGSIYSLATTESVLAYGGPESILHLWDPRAGQRITKFRGHTGNVRSILLSPACDTVVTCATDHTVKIWSVTAGRCMHTLTMHDAPVFSLDSEDPELKVFYSADRDGLIAKTDIRAPEVDDGLALAVAQEHDMVFKVVAAGNYIWTATQRSSINRWRNVDTGAGIQLPESFRQHRASVSSSISPTSTAPANAKSKEIPARSILRISNTAKYPTQEVFTSLEADTGANAFHVNDVEPLQHVPQETIEGQFGLVKHRLLADKRRVLTLDTAGDVLLWDLIRCKPIQSFGKKHLEDVEPLVNTLENVSPWCSVDTSSGNLTVVLEPFNCFDAEMYADELEVDEPVEFRDDQRINHGKWVLRYLFSNLIDEEIRRDEAHRQKLNEAVDGRVMAAQQGKPAMRVQIPPPSPDDWEEAVESPTTPRPSGSQFVPMTPGGMGIGLATPILPGVRAEGAASPMDKRMSGDYFSSAITSATNNGQSKPAATPATDPVEDKTAKSEDGKEKDEKKDERKEKEKEKDKGDGKTFGKKFRMSFSTKKLGRSGSSTVAEKPAVVDEKAAESESSSSHEPEKEFEDSFLGVIQKIQNDYEKQLAENPEKHVETKITPSLPNETPVLKIPLGTKVIIQEETGGGNAELYRGTVESVGQEADEIERCAPQWLAEVLLLNTIPQKEPVKVSFVLHPWPDSGLPVLAPADGNNRLNANKMLRVKKILAYVAERIDPTSSTQAEEADDEQNTSNKSDETEQEKKKETPGDDDDALKPEEYLELYCNDQLLPVNMTLATLRAYIWKGGNDVVLYYKANGKKAIPQAPTPEENAAASSPQGGDTPPATTTATGDAATNTGVTEPSRTPPQAAAALTAA